MHLIWVLVASKMGISSEQDARTTMLLPLLKLRFKCRKT